MANLDVDNFLGVTDKRHGKGTSTSVIATPTNYDDVASMRTRLAAINATYYTSARLDQMTKNDMVYAIRRADDAAGL